MQPGRDAPPGHAIQRHRAMSRYRVDDGSASDETGCSPTARSRRGLATFAIGSPVSSTRAVLAGRGDWNELGTRTCVPSTSLQRDHGERPGREPPAERRSVQHGVTRHRAHEIEILLARQRDYWRGEVVDLETPPHDVGGVAIGHPYEAIGPIPPGGSLSLGRCRGRRTVRLVEHRELAEHPVNRARPL